MVEIINGEKQHNHKTFRRKETEHEEQNEMIAKYLAYRSRDMLEATASKENKQYGKRKTERKTDCKARRMKQSRENDKNNEETRTEL